MSNKNIPEGSIEIMLFEPPSGNVVGVANAFVMINGKRKRIAHATLLSGEKPKVALEMSKTVNLDELAELSSILSEFSAQLKKTASQE